MKFSCLFIIYSVCMKTGFCKDSSKPHHEKKTYIIMRVVRTLKEHLFFFSFDNNPVHRSTRPLWSSGLSPCRQPLLCWTIAPLPGQPQPLQEQL